MKAHVLIVDDEPSARYVLVYLMTKLAYRVSQAKDGREAFDLICDRQKQGDRIDLVITDIQMPRMSGTELIRKMKRKRIDVPVLVISGYDDNALQEELHESGCNHILLKPYDFDDLSNHVETLLNENRVERGRPLNRTYEMRPSALQH